MAQINEHPFSAKIVAEAVPSTLAHIGLIAPRMRAADRAEVLASHGYTAAQALLVGFAESAFARTLFIGGEAAAMFGVGTGRLWALTTDVAEQHPRAFWQASKYVVWQIRQRFPALGNCIDARHEQALRWTRRLGFEVEKKSHRCGLAGLPFHRIALGKG